MARQYKKDKQPTTQKGRKRRGASVAASKLKGGLEVVREIGKQPEASQEPSTEVSKEPANAERASEAGDATKCRGAHTPGPWKASPDGEGYYDIRIEGTGDYIGNSGVGDNIEAEANAALMAAAPELLEALKTLLLPQGHYGAYDNARKAITKATEKVW